MGLGWDELLCRFPRLAFLTTCSDHSKPYMILTALDQSYKNHIGFAIIRATGEEWQARERSEAPV